MPVPRMRGAFSAIISIGRLSVQSSYFTQRMNHDTVDEPIGAVRQGRNH